MSDADSQQAGADLVWADAGALATYIDEASGSIFGSREMAGRWSSPVQRVGGISGAWVRGNITKRDDGRRVEGWDRDEPLCRDSHKRRLKQLSVPIHIRLPMFKFDR